MVFKDRVACLLPPRLRATVLLRCTPFNLGGRILYFESAFLSSDRCRFALAVSARPVSSRGAEPTSLPPSLSTRFVDPSLPPVRLSSFGAGRRLLPLPRWVSTPLVDFVFRLSLLRSGPPSPVRLRLSVRGGAASTTAAFGVNHLRRLSLPAHSSLSLL